ncbi:uncharacterized protein FFC1_02487 [Fusarium fujikuroi]|nr:uncharacterized protein FFC1_02487 [Fusarium fujikuroi]
MVFKEEV